MSRTFPLIALALILCPVAIGCQGVSHVNSPAAVAPAHDSGTAGLIRALGLPLIARRSQHFELIASDGLWSESVSRKLETFYSAFFDRLAADGFDVRPPIAARLVWIAFDSRADFDRYVAMSECVNLAWLDCFYSGRTNRVAVIRRDVVESNRGAGEALAADSSRDTDSPMAALAALAPDVGVGGDWFVPVRHEAAHQLSFNCGLLTRGVTYPLWVSEGLATNFELGLPTDGGVNNARRDCVRQCVRSGQAVPLDELIGATCVQGSSAKCLRTYGFAWAFFRFAYQRHREEFKRYLAALAEKRADCGDRATRLRAEFDRAFGPLDRIEPEWSQFVRGI